MTKITSSESLKRAIIVLENRQMKEEQLFKDQFTVTYESLKPINVLRKTINDLLTLSDLKEPLFETATGIISGYLSRLLIIRNSKNPLIRLAGIFAQYSITNLVSKNSNAILKVCLGYLHKLTNHFQKEKD